MRANFLVSNGLFVLLAYASLAPSRTLLQWLLACLNFTLESEVYPFGTNEKTDLSKLWKQHKQLKTMEMSETWSDIFYEGYIHQLQPESTPKLTSTSRSTKLKIILPWNIYRLITKTISISMRIVISYAMRWGILLWIWWNINGNWDNNISRVSQWRESHCRIHTSMRRNT